MPDPAGPVADPGAAFVTLRSADGTLRGCIGRTVADRPLGRVVADMARAAALEDPRFPPVTPAEVAGLRIEVSVLTPPVAASPEELEPGRHGVQVAGRGRSGLLLPQVAVEHGLTREQFLLLACRKAGLPDTAWAEDDVEVRLFTAEVIEEPAPPASD